MKVAILIAALSMVPPPTEPQIASRCQQSGQFTNCKTNPPQRLALSGGGTEAPKSPATGGGAPKPKKCWKDGKRVQCPKTR